MNKNSKVAIFSTGFVLGIVMTITGITTELIGSLLGFPDLLFTFILLVIGIFYLVHAYNK